jgi:hypothetical protein
MLQVNDYVVDGHRCLFKCMLVHRGAHDLPLMFSCLEILVQQLSIQFIVKGYDDS